MMHEILVTYLENNQFVLEVGLKQSHFNFRLSRFTSKSSCEWWNFRFLLFRLRLHKHGDSRSMSWTRCFPNVVPPVFWTCKNTITSLPLMLNSKFSCWIVLKLTKSMSICNGAGGGAEIIKRRKSYTKSLLKNTDITVSWARIIMHPWYLCKPYSSGGTLTQQNIP